MIRCTYRHTVHHCDQICGRVATHGMFYGKSNTIFPACKEHRKRKHNEWMDGLPVKWFPIKKAIRIAESR